MVPLAMGLFPDLNIITGEIMPYKNKQQQREYQRKWQKAKVDKMREEDWVAYEAHLEMRRKTNLKYRQGDSGVEQRFIYNRTRRVELKHEKD